MAKKMKLSVKDLRQEGFKIRVKHRRQLNLFDQKGRPLHLPMSLYEFAELLGEEPGQVREDFFSQVAMRGGQTSLEVLTPDGKVLEAHADCSLKDNYDKKVGVQIALGRLQKQLQKEAMTA